MYNIISHLISLRKFMSLYELKKSPKWYLLATQD